MTKQRFIALSAVLFAGMAQGKSNEDCAKLSTSDPGVKVISADRVDQGSLSIAHDGQSMQLPGLAKFCRVTGSLHPSPASNIGFEVWLPDDWNGRYLQTGNGGFAGSINYIGLMQGLRQGFAVASTDDGATGDDARWAIGQPEQVEDFAYRAVHLTSIAAKVFAERYYRRRADRSYFSGCSEGGREGLLEAQRYSDDFDGWLIGAPANNFTGLMLSLLNVTQALSRSGERLTQAQLDALQQATLRKCDRLDGVVDGLVSAPLRCELDPAELSCKNDSASKDVCLSAAQVDVVRRIYDDVRHPVTGTSLAPGYRATRGSEGGEGEWHPFYFATSSGSDNAEFFASHFWPYMVYGKADLNVLSLDLYRASVDAQARLGALLNAVNPDLNAARAGGKKIIQYHGWADAAIPAQSSIAYYESVEKYVGQDIRDFYRLFMVPGMGHCHGGAGPNSFGGMFMPEGRLDSDHNALQALVRWVEQGQAPERIIATKYQDEDASQSVLRTRPICVYPKVARWLGRGSIDDAGNFECE
jgi:feruloyl esterase